MGFFSFKTSDTKQSIPNIHSGRSTFTVHMITEDGRVFTENEYDGYGRFGGKDIYELIAELNNLPGKNIDEKRSAAIDLLYETHIIKGDCSYKQGTDFSHWEMPLPSEGGKTPKQLTKDEGWKIFYPNGYGDFNKAAQNGIKLPKLVRLESSLGKFYEFPYPEDCPDQGFFY